MLRFGFLLLVFSCFALAAKAESGKEHSYIIKDIFNISCDIKQGKYSLNYKILNSSDNVEIITSCNLYWDEKYGPQTGIASSYGKEFQYKETTNGELYDMHQLTAAHKKLPFGSIVKVTNLQKGKAFGKVVFVRINDRGPFVKGRIIDLSKAAAKVIGMPAGLFKVKLEIVKCKDLDISKIVITE
ncbi:MAG: septal ring lytic transglycosylase RlpA family protein [Candidatus Margulisbacteria bacterium]|nr:septal ring lytic transglycosylase RlpA family protein [Candidatus Margulisiibacteriota bacterium]